MSPTAAHGLVVVGVDFSKGNEAALEYAAAVASRRHLPLELLYAVDPRSAPSTYLALSMPEITEAAEGELADQADAVRQDNPGLEVRTKFVAQSPSDALVDESGRATMVVLGSRGHGSFSELLLGSVAWRVTSRAVGPVVLVRPGELVGQVAAGSVLVGLDGSESSLKALAFAFEEASSRRASLVAVTVWALPHPEGLAIGRDWPAGAAEWQTEMESDAARILSEALAGCGEEHGDVSVTEVVVHGLNVPRTLLEVAADRNADLIVVGARGTNAYTNLVLGAVGVQLSQHADRTVAVIHA